MRQVTNIAVVLLAAAAGPAQAEELRFVMANGAHAFAATIATQCLTAATASAEANGNIVTVRDEPRCAKEIREIAGNWGLYAADPIVTMSGTPEALSMVRERLEQRFGKAPNRSLRFLASTQTCRCLAFVGKRQAEAAALAGRLLPRLPGAASGVTARAEPLLRPRTGPESPLEAPVQDLIMGIGPAPAAPAGGALVN